MAHWKKAFPSRYLQVSDLDDGPIAALIKSVGAENVGSGDDAELKLVVKFHGDIKALVCNLTRAEAIAEIAGSEDTDEWPGTKIQIARGTTRFQGKRVSCIVVQAPTAATRTDDDTTAGVPF